MVGRHTRSRSRSRERLDRFGRVIPRRSRTGSRSKSRSRSRSRSSRRRRRSRSRSRSPHHRRRYSRSRSDSRSRSRHRPRDGHVTTPTTTTNIEDPQFLNARLFIGSLPSDKVTKEEVEDLFKSYGKILGMCNNLFSFCLVSRFSPKNSFTF